MRNTTIAALSVIALLVVLTILPQSGLAQEAQSFQGDLVALDTQAQTITVQNAEEMSMTFTYNDQTEVLGAESGIQGLAGSAGTEVRVTYSSGEGAEEAPLASQIVVLPE